jgi:hypothetical protein
MECEPKRTRERGTHGRFLDGERKRQAGINVSEDT